MSTARNSASRPLRSVSPPLRIPAQRSGEGASLTQRNARSGNRCEVCGDVRLTEIRLTLTDGSTVEFVSCQHCETKSWRAAETGEYVDLDFDAVIARTRKIR